VEQTNEREIKRDMNFWHYFAWLFRVYVALGIVDRFSGILLLHVWYFFDKFLWILVLMCVFH
jgi:hypothetical protein